MCFSVIFVKACRIYYIHTNPTKNKKVCLCSHKIVMCSLPFLKYSKHGYLFIAIGLLVAMDMIILIIFTGIPSTRFVASKADHPIYPSTIGVSINLIMLFMLIY